MKKIILLALILILLMGCIQTPKENELNNNELINEKELNELEEIEKELEEKEFEEEKNEEQELEEIEKEFEEELIEEEFDEELIDEGYMGALPDLLINTLVPQGKPSAGDEVMEFILVVRNASPVPILLTNKSITIKLIDLDSNQEIAVFRDGPYIELVRFLGNYRFSYRLTTINNPEFLKTPGIKKFKAIVDSENQIKEKNELNNEKEFEITILE
jgi:hypothetical protein